MILDRDLQSIQKVRNLIARAKEAEKILAAFSQERLDAICEAIADACMEHGAELARQAAEETGFGNAEDKVIKNRLGSGLRSRISPGMKMWPSYL